MTTRGTVREWHDGEGWGVIDSPATPGGCWVHHSGVAVSDQSGLRIGQDVAFTYEAGEQDGFGYRARRAWPWGAEPTRRPGTTTFNDRSGAFSSTLTLTFDDPDTGSPPARTTHWPPPPEPVLGTVTVTVYEAPSGRNEVAIDSGGTLDEHLIDTAIAELQRIRGELDD